MPALESFDLDQLIPAEEYFRIRGREIGIAPVFSVADHARYLRIQERLAYEAQAAASTQERLSAYLAARIAAEQAHEPVPEPPEPEPRPAQFPPYTNEDFERDALDLLARIWQASDAARPEAEREQPTPQTVRDLFSVGQAWTVVQRLWPRRYGPRTAAPARPQSATPEPTPAAPKASRRSRRSSTAS